MNQNNLIPTKLSHILDGWKRYVEASKDIKVDIEEGEATWKEQITEVLFNEVLNFMTFQVNQLQIIKENIFEWITETIATVEKETGLTFEPIQKQKIYITGFTWDAGLHGEFELAELGKLQQLAMKKQRLNTLKSLNEKEPVKKAQIAAEIANLESELEKIEGDN